MRRSVVVLAVVSLAVLTGCGDDDEAGEASQSSTTTAAATQTTAGGGRFCELFRSYTDKFSQSQQLREGDQLRDLLGDARSSVNEAKDVAPPDVKADMEVVARVVNDYVDALEDADFNASRIRADTAQSLISPDFLGAAQRVTTYVTANCR